MGIYARVARFNEELGMMNEEFLCDKWEFMCVFIFHPQMTRMTQILYFFLW